MKKAAILIWTAFMLPLALFSQEKTEYTPIILDDVFSEWDQFTDLANAQASGNLTIKASNDDKFLYLYFETAEMVNLQNDEQIKLYIDTDNNSSTGYSINGIGAELVYNYGRKTGYIYINGTSYTVGPKELYMTISPTVWSNKFEISIDRNAVFGGSNLFSGSQINILTQDLSSGNLSPEQNGGANYSFQNLSFNSLPPYSIAKTNEEYLRVMSHNVLFDNIFESQTIQDAFKRMYQAVKPEIIGFQEIYDHSASEVAALLDAFNPLPDNKKWNGANIADNHLITPYTIKSAEAMNGTANGAFLLDLRPTYNTDLFVIVAHTPCCSNDDGRQQEIDAMMAYLRDAKNGTASIQLQANTPILIMGDMNLVGNPQQWTTLLAGDIVDQNTYGSDFTPDWNGNNLIDSKPLTNSLPMTFTHWDSPGSGVYSKGRLDALIYSASNLELKNNFVLYTNDLPTDSLSAYNMQKNDSETASDHLPLIADFQVNSNQEQSFNGIKEYRKNDTEGIPKYLNQQIQIAGIITADEEFGNNLAYIQDNEAGIMIYGQEFGNSFTTGDSITISGKVGFYNGLTKLIYDATNFSVQVHQQSNIPSPKKHTINEINNQQWNSLELIEGTLIELENVEFIQNGTFEAATSYQLKNGTEQLNFLINENSALIGQQIPQGKINVIGICSQYDNTTPYSEGYQIQPRKISDISEYTEPNGLASVRQNNADGVPVLENQTIEIHGIITTDNEFGSNGPAFLQDEKYGVALYGNEFTENFQRGDSVSLRAKVVNYNGLTEMTITNDWSYTIHKNTSEPEPEVVTISDILTQKWDDIEDYEGKLVKFENVSFVQTGNFVDGTYNYSITDGISSIILRVDPDTDVFGKSIPQETGSVVAIVGQYDNSSPFSAGYQLLLREYSDLHFSSSTSIKENVSPYFQNLRYFPNPAKEYINFKFNCIEKTKIGIQIFDLNGKNILNVNEKMYNKGKNEIHISLNKIVKGNYLARLKANNDSITISFLVE